MINLQNYIIRRSKRKQPSYILEVINKTTPERVRFEFVSEVEERECLPVLERVVELAFDSMINGMIVPEFTSSSRSTPLKQPLTKHSIGRLADPSSP